jgi:hypothetical protein
MRIAASFRGRRAIAATATAAAATAVIGLTVPAMAASAAASSRIAGPAATASAVPWSKVGPGWALAMYSASQAEVMNPKAGPSTLYLVDPQGARYKLITWSATSAQASWYLLGWSGDGKRALFTTAPGLVATGREHIYQLTLRTGKVSGFTLPANVTAVGYTRPDGLNLLAEKGTLGNGSSSITVQRYNLTGKLQKDLATVKGLDLMAGITGIPPLPYNSNGTEIAAGAANGLELISNSGGVIRKLPVPGASDGCNAVRWWSKSSVLASCFVPNEAGPQMWLVPASGARPSALTPVRTGGFDLGDFNAWQLSSGLYVDGYGACGSLVIGRQPAHGTEQEVNVPGAGSALAVNATRSKLMVERINGCTPEISLVWYNPATRAMKVAIPVGRNQRGVTAVVPYFIAGKF